MLDFEFFDIANGSRAPILPWKPTFSHQKRSGQPEVMVRSSGERLLGSFPQPASIPNVSAFLASIGENESFASLGFHTYPWQLHGSFQPPSPATSNQTARQGQIETLLVASRQLPGSFHTSSFSAASQNLLSIVQHRALLDLSPLSSSFVASDVRVRFSRTSLTLLVASDGLLHAPTGVISSSSGCSPSSLGFLTQKPSSSSPPSNLTALRRFSQSLSLSQSC